MSNLRDVEDMAKNAVHILSENDTLAQFRANALEQARKFDISKIVPVYEALYKRFC